jgi:hypothetical protein
MKKPKRMSAQQIDARNGQTVLEYEEGGIFHRIRYKTKGTVRRMLLLLLSAGTVERVAVQHTAFITHYNRVGDAWTQDRPPDTQLIPN